MLIKLSISNYALIDSASVGFSNGLTTITGESGAGKSIMLEAIGLILGGRSNFASIRKGEDKCIVEAVFLANSTVNALIKENGLDEYEELTIRRELTQNGRSRAFVNDTPVNVNVLRTLGVELIDLHGQHENLSLQTSGFKFHHLDSFAKASVEFDQYKKAYGELQAIEKRYNDLLDAAAQVRKDKDYFQFQYDELSKSDFSDIELESLEQEVKTLENAKEIIQSLAQAGQISEMDNGIQQQLSEMQRILNGIASYSAPLQKLSERLESISLELRDLTYEVEQSADSVNVDPDQLRTTQETLDELHRLFHKHNVSSIKELESILHDYELKLSGIDSFDDELAGLESQLATNKAVASSGADELSKVRTKSISQFGNEVEGLLHQLGMPKARFVANLKSGQEFGPYGQDQVAFLLDANGDDNLQPIEEVASGGESARLMLALKAVSNQDNKALTMIFDEIDTGVSGEVAKRIGSLMQRLASSNQVLAVTHSPGVAAKGKNHLKIFKHEVGGRMVSQFAQLTEKNRIDELAGMFSGDSITDASRESAKGLLSEDN
ncbi:DNA repair protein RecN [Salibacteraceae bacterium]|nr:DNA repair protein RecN [Flavobacteriales bacterium]MDB9701735.1 DNA repair protein RecN [Salibacteraceae bacterium]